MNDGTGKARRRSKAEDRPPVVVTDTGTLAEHCRLWSEGGVLYFDTEFVRETTYWANLCLIQAAGARREAVAIDPLADGIDLAPFFDLLHDERVLKVLHAGRQDIEIVVNLTGRPPAPLFDTQIAAMVCGFGDSVGYDSLVRALVGAQIDKSSRFSDWARRPLDRRQLRYALSDVVYLPEIHDRLQARLDETGRAPWVAAEVAELTDPETYRIDPDTVWQRLKTRSSQPRFLAIVRALAATRERLAQQRNVPRQRIVRDETLLDIAAHKPKDAQALAQARGLSRDIARGVIGRALLDAVREGLGVPDQDCPRRPRREAPPKEVGPLVDLLRTLMKARSEQHGVAAKLLATTDQLEKLVLDPAADCPITRGWRRDLFGEDALALLRGELGFAVRDRQVRMFPITPDLLGD